MKTLVRQHARRLAQKNLDDIAGWVLEQGTSIQQIPAPTFSEQDRARYVAEQFDALGLDDVQIDAIHNVFGVMRGEQPGRPGLMLMSHTDTVFPSATDLTITRTTETLCGPGLGDNSIGVGGILGVAYALQQFGIRPASDLWFVATSREEGLGDLDGARLAYRTLQDQIGAVINVEGLAYGYVYHAGIAVRRLHIVARTQGGHSWLHFGRPSAVHMIAQLGAAITQIDPPKNPRTTYNIGLIEGGHSINSIATEAAVWLDLRSEDTAALQQLEQQVRAEIHRLNTDDVTFSVELVGDRPAGHIQVSHPLVQGALSALEETGVRGSLQIGSTDGNIPLSSGCPTVTVGITRGGNAHRLDEFVETGPVSSGMRHLLILVLAAAEYQTRLQTAPR